MKTVIITPEDSVGYAETWTEWFDCPNCKDSDITRYYSYCPRCGAKIEHVWEIEKAEATK